MRHILSDGVIMVASLFVSLFLRLGPVRMPDYLLAGLMFVPITLGVRLLCMYSFGCYRVIWRYTSIADGIQLVKALGLSTLILLAFSFLTPAGVAVLPRSVYFIDAVLTLLALTGVRLARRIRHEGESSRQTRAGRRTLIYGAGNNGRLLANRFRSDAGLGTHLVGFIDDDIEKQRSMIAGVPVLGTLDQLREMLSKENISQLIVAIPNLSGSVLMEIVAATRPFNIQPRMMTQLAIGKKTVETYREIQVADLLNRAPTTVDLEPVKEMVQGKRVLITGAGGSIGSELARQIMSHEPGRLMLLDHSEFNLYEIDKELRISTQENQRVVPLLIDCKDKDSLSMAMREFAPEIVFHAAAYKHVHLVEGNPYSSILNNVYGTQVLLDCCEEVGVERFVLISTDKAVNPAGIMGATKRICELLTTIKALRTGKQYCSTRFGNVLGSSGSLIPLLQRQIQEGGPVTVTHPDVTRFFMLIPEAVSLVLKAATISRPGDISVLKMGEPVKIVDVARSLIALCGKTEEEIPIMFTGLRPGEKMFEELYIRGDELTTEHPDILTLPNGDSPLQATGGEIENVINSMERMVQAAKKGSKEALFELNELVKSKYLAAGLNKAAVDTHSNVLKVPFRHNN